MINKSMGSIWRKWDLHVHTKGTFKNDQFSSATFEEFCNCFFKKALQHNIEVIGITDYFNIVNYNSVISYINTLNDNVFFNDEEKEKIKNIYLLPNVELRVLPVTDRGKLVNFHCLLNPDLIEYFENDFFGSLTMLIGNESYTMNDYGIRKLGKSKGANDANAFKIGIESYVLSHETIIKLFKEKPILRDNIITVVSNSNSDGNSAYQKHYDFFEGIENHSLDEVRKAIYCLSDFIFSGNKGDYEYFLGRKRNSQGSIIDDEEIVKHKCGGLKGCIHGSDAHTEEKLFKPEANRYCWIKADPTFDGLKQVLIEPDSRVFIGEAPPIIKRLKENRTKFIKSIQINHIKGYKNQQGIWFDNIEIPINPELTTIIGNKGSGKSAISDIIGLNANANIKEKDYSFLNNKKFNTGGGKISKYFESTIEFESGFKPSRLLNDFNRSEIELVKYIPQGVFEELTNNIVSIDDFKKEIENVVFSYVDDEEKLGANSFEELISKKDELINYRVNEKKDNLIEINKLIIQLEEKSNPEYLHSIQNKLKAKEDELNALIIPTLVEDPNNDPKISEANSETINKINNSKLELIELKEQIDIHKTNKSILEIQLNELNTLKGEILLKINEVNDYKDLKRNIAEKYKLNMDEIILVSYDTSQIDIVINSIKQSQHENRFELGELEIEGRISLSKKYEKLTKEIEALQLTLDGQQLAYQKYLNDLEQFNTKKNTIIGDVSKYGSIEYFKNEIKYLVEKLSEDLYEKRISRITVVEQIFNIKSELIELYNKIKSKIDTVINNNSNMLNEFQISIKASMDLRIDFPSEFLNYISKNVKGTYFGNENAEVVFKKQIEETDFSDYGSIRSFLENIINSLETDKRDKSNAEQRLISTQVADVIGFYNYLFSLDFIVTNYDLMQGDKKIETLSPGEKGALLLVFYLLLDNNDCPLIIDQPEDNLDNYSVANILVPFIKYAKNKRQIIMVTHNPNLAIVADAEEVIYVKIDKENQNKFYFESGSIENKQINEKIVEVLEGTMPAFTKRKQKYYD